MGRPRLARHPKAAPAIEPEDTSQEEIEELESTEPDEDEPAPAPRRGRPPKAKDGTISKAEAVRRALAAGHDGPQEGTAYIKKEFGIEVAPQHFSATKSQLKKREGGGEGNAKRGRKPKEAAEGDTPPASKRQAPGDQADLLAALKAIKPLVAQMGADKVHELVDLLG